MILNRFRCRRPLGRCLAGMSLLLLLPAPSSNFRQALPGYLYEFPRDHGSHPDFKLEWWYFTGRLVSDQGREFGYELTFFRSALEGAARTPSSWRVRDLYPAHLAITDVEKGGFYYFEKLNRAGPGIAGADLQRLHVWNENWSADQQEEGIVLSAAEEGTGLDLKLTGGRGPIIHGQEGVSQKGTLPGEASHYYSLTRLESKGTLRLQGEEFVVSGLSWMDHEFSTHQLTPEQIGWDWFSIHLDQGDDLMLFQIRRSDGSIDSRSAGTVITGDSEPRHLSRSFFELRASRNWTSPETGGSYPLQWQIQIPSLQANLLVEAVQDKQELVTTRSTGVAYWEGLVRVSGQWRGETVEGAGYLEMTGYAPDSRPRI